MALERDAESAVLTAEQRRQYVSGMRETLDRMRRLLDDILNVEAFKSGHVPLRRSRVDLAEVVQRTVEEHRTALNGHRLVCDLPTVFADVDAAKVERIVENLLLNAVRHTPAGTRVEVSVTQRDGQAVICVDDTGPGVPEDMRTHIFERLRKSPGSSRDGLGMGLSLVARLAEWHGGRAWVEERPGGGAAFRIAVPAAPSGGRGETE
jgi:signal transduction histidine kinase